jgi:hypothetical protein
MLERLKPVLEGRAVAPRYLTMGAALIVSSPARDKSRKDSWIMMGRRPNQTQGYAYLRRNVTTRWRCYVRCDTVLRR